MGTAALSLLIFGVAGRCGYGDRPQRAPELTALILAFNLSAPMLLWMRPAQSPTEALVEAA